MKKSKQAYFDKYFETNWNNIVNIWKGIKSLISLKTNFLDKNLRDNGDTHWGTGSNPGRCVFKILRHRHWRKLRKN